MATRKPTRRSGEPPASSTAALPRADLHVYRSPVAGPLLLHIPTSRLFSISPEVADQIEGSNGQLPAEEISQLAIELAELKPPAPEAETDEVPGPARWASLTLLLTDRCNLDCAYCFAHYRPLRRRGANMTREVAGAALDLLVAHAPPDACGLYLHFFGGEPLLAWDMVEWATEEGQRRAEKAGKPFYPLISTNAVGLTAQQAGFLREHGFDVSVSLDGSPEVHDRGRPLTDGQGSWQAAMQALALLGPDRPPFTSVGARLYRGNTDVFTNFLAAYDATGGRVGISFRTVQLPPDHGLALRGPDIDDLLDSYRRLYAFLFERLAAGEYGHIIALLLGNDYSIALVKRLLSRSVGTRRCQAGLTDFAVSTGGEVYPCGGLVGLPAGRVGNVWQGLEDRARKAWHSLDVGSRRPCRTCWARSLCGGGCYAQALVGDYGLGRPDPLGCQLTRGLLEIAIELVARGEMEAPGRIDDLLAQVLGGLPARHQAYVPPVMRRRVERPRVDSVIVEPRIAKLGDTITATAAVHAWRPLESVSLQDSGGGVRVLRMEQAGGGAWPRAVICRAEEAVGARTPAGLYHLWLVAVDTSGLRTAVEAGTLRLKAR